MYTVTVCGNCHTFWMYKDRPERTDCRRCGKSHQVKKLQSVYTSDDASKARAAIASLRAQRQNRNDELKEAIEEYNIFDSDVETNVRNDEALERLGVDVDEVNDAANVTRGSSSTQKETVLEGVKKHNPASTAEIIEYASGRGVDADKAYEILEKLHRGAEITKVDEDTFKPV